MVGGWRLAVGGVWQLTPVGDRGPLAVDGQLAVHRFAGEAALGDTPNNGYWNTTAAPAKATAPAPVLGSVGQQNQVAKPAPAPPVTWVEHMPGKGMEKWDPQYGRREMGWGGCGNPSCARHKED